MKNAIRWMIDNHVTVNLVMVLFIVFGIAAALNTNQEIFPEIKVDVVSVQMVYRGATPEDIENSVVVKIEEAISDISGIEAISSVSSEGLGVVSAEVEIGEDVNLIKDKIETEVNRILTFPVDAEKPVITIAERNRSVIQIGLAGDLNDDEMNKIAQRVKEDLTAFKDISQVAISGTKNYEINIEVSKEKLSEHGLKLADISAIIKQESFDMPSGKIKRKGDEILLRTKGVRYRAEDYRNLIIKSNFNGADLTLGDIATIKDGYEESDLYSYFNGKPAVMLKVYRTGDQSAIEIANTVKAYINKVKVELPEGVDIIPWQNQAKILEERLDLMLRNAALGFLLVLITLTLFLDFRLALWISMGIAISFLGAFLVMHFVGVTINLISLFAFILVLGIVVDDAIVVGEEIYTNKELGLGPKEASKKGTVRIAVPVIFSVLTTVATFSPLLFVDGRMGQVMYAIPIIVISILLFSLLESLFILPAHLSTIKLESKTGIVRLSRGLTFYVDRGLQFFLKHMLTPTLKKVLKFRYISVAVFIAIFIASLGVIAGGILKFTFMPSIESDNAVAYLKMPEGTSIQRTKQVIDQIENAMLQAKKDYEEKYPEFKGKVIKNAYVIIGEQPSLARGPNGRKSQIADPSKAEINIELPSSEVRQFATKDFIDAWRKYVGKISGIESLEFQSVLMSVGDDIRIDLSGEDYKRLNASVEMLKEKLRTYSGVYNIKDDFLEGKYEIKFALTERGRMLGVRLIDISTAIRNRFLGDEVMRIQRGRDEVKVRVQLPEQSRKSIDTIKSMKIRTNTGLEVPFSDIATFTMERGYSNISHSEKKRVIRVTASVDSSLANAGEINAKFKGYLQKNFKKKFFDVDFKFEGSQKEQKKSMGSLRTGFILALFIVYMLLAIPFKSYVQPFIIMLSIPFGVVGAIWAHYFFGFNFTFMSAIGVVALSGVVVNDSLVLVDYINELFRNEENLTPEKKQEYVVRAVNRRFRPILLTTVTTFFGLMPMIAEKSIQAQFLIPMALSLGFGILFTTFVIIFLIPSGILIVEDMKRLWQKISGEA